MTYRKTGCMKYKGHKLCWHPKLKSDGKGYDVIMGEGRFRGKISSGRTIKQAIRRAKRNVNEIFYSKKWP